MSSGKEIHSFCQILKRLWNKKVSHCCKSKSKLLNSNSCHLLSTYQVPGTELSLYVYISLVLSTTLWGGYCYYSHVTDETVKLSIFPRSHG